MLKIEIAVSDANAAHKAATMLECPQPNLFCGLCPYEDGCETLTLLSDVLKDVKDDVSKH